MTHMTHMTTTRTPAEKLADWKAKYPNRLAQLDAILRQRHGIPNTKADATVAVWRDDLLGVVFGLGEDAA